MNKIIMFYFPDFVFKFMWKNKLVVYLILVFHFVFMVYATYYNVEIIRIMSSYLFSTLIFVPPTVLNTYLRYSTGKVGRLRFSRNRNVNKILGALLPVIGPILTIAMLEQEIKLIKENNPYLDRKYVVELVTDKGKWKKLILTYDKDQAILDKKNRGFYKSPR